MKRFAYAVAVLLAAGCSTIPNRQALEVSPEVLAVGTTIYFGSSFPLKGATAEPAFIYERRVESREGEQRSTHIPRTPTGAIAIVESAAHSNDYVLREYTLHTNQLGQSGAIQVEGEQVTLRLGERTATERQTLPVVTGPTLVGFIFRHLEQVRRGEVFKVRLAVLDRLETIGFELKSVEAAPGQTRVKMSADSFFISLAVAPIFFTFDSTTGKLVRLEGRVPPKLESGGSWTDFDARVEYRFVADAYR